MSLLNKIVRIKRIIPMGRHFILVPYVLLLCAVRLQNLICCFMIWKILDRHLYNCFYFFLQKLINHRVHFKENKFWYLISKNWIGTQSYFYVSFMSEVKFIKEGIFLKFIMNFTHITILIYNFLYYVCYKLQMD